MRASVVFALVGILVVLELAVTAWLAFSGRY